MLIACHKSLSDATCRDVRFVVTKATVYVGQSVGQTLQTNPLYAPFAIVRWAKVL